MSIDYRKLWKRLIDIDMTKTQLREKAEFSTRVLADMNKGEPIHLKYIESICKVLDCSIEDIIEITPDK